ncbi:HEPN domain-containing protein [Bosea sp. (in: a-proteobacteria)]|uniref:HEPN domain-containing protein n=1 Tax=Bosea sp. (in: a-proteobacteria) TaxID=1871050 RepID=UPI0027334BD2|nr:HEPN domain-containing protein [Bosea sp. (in: a-proteobacteria)]MDP3407865.1 hypothetical protein [Bosea sp. (in: a-proteobacteria)]
MTTYDSAIKLRSSSNNIGSIWNLGRVKAFGNLIIDNKRPILELFVEIKDSRQKSAYDIDNSVIKAIKPPLQPNIDGYVAGHGFISLENCACSSINLHSSASINKSIAVIQLIPTKIWLGTPLKYFNGTCNYVFLFDDRITGFFGESNITCHHSRGDRRKDPVFDLLGNPTEIWALAADNSDWIEVPSMGFKLKKSSSISSQSSSTSGYAFKSLSNIIIKFDKPQSFSDADNIIMKIEHLLSVFSLEPFEFNYKRFEGKSVESIGLIWRLSSRRAQFVQPMNHQILIDFSDAVQFKAALNEWFSGSEKISLSRWIFQNSLEETDSGLARFVNVCQALEVLGRELFGRQSAGGDLDEMADLISEKFSDTFGVEIIERAIGLLKSSNKLSFRILLERMIFTIVDSINLGTEKDIKLFCKRIASMRNSITHMSDNRDISIKDAYAKVNKSSLMLSYMYAVITAKAMGLSLERANSFLINNRNARHGLPNEILESL